MLYMRDSIQIIGGEIRMCTKEEAERSRSVRRKYRRWKEVDSEDLNSIGVFYNLGLVDFRFENNVMYARIF